MTIAIKKILLLILSIGFLFFYGQTNAGFFDAFNQPHLAVVSYNELLESIKAYALEGVSIYTNDDLYLKWSNIIASIGILIIFLMLVQITLAIFKNSKDNLKRDLALLSILLILSTIFTPFFSVIGSQMSGSERTYEYTNETKKEDFTRIYLPSNKAISIQPYYIDEKGNKITMESSGLLEKRKQVFPNDDSNIFKNDYLGIPAKVFQTQWVSQNTPTERYSKAFYSVNVDVLFNGMEWPIKNLSDITGTKDCTIQVENINGTLGDGAPLTFMEAIGRTDLVRMYEGAKKDETGKNIKPFEVQGKEIPGATTQVKVKDCNLGLYFLSNEYFSTYKGLLKSNDDFNSIMGSMIMQDFLSGKDGTETITNGIYDNLDYVQQKRVSYTLKAISNLLLINGLKDKNLKSDENLKNIQLACGRIISDKVQGNEDFKTCLKGDAYGDTTIYTKDTTQKIGLSGKNKEINGGYVMPVAQSADWNLPLYYKIETNFAGIASIVADAAGAGFLKNLANGVANTFVEEASKMFLLPTAIFKTIKALTTPSAEVLQAIKEIEIADNQKIALFDKTYWNVSGQNPQLVSFQSYDLNGDGISDYNQQSFKNENFYAYHYASSFDKISGIDLTSRNINILNTPLYEVTKFEGQLKDEVLNSMGSEKDTNEKSFAFKELISGKISIITEKDATDSTIFGKIINGKKYYYLNEVENNLTSLNGLDYYESSLKKGQYSYLFEKKGNDYDKLSLKIKDSGSYEYFLTPGLVVNYYEDEKMINKTSLSDNYELEFSGYFISNGKSENFSSTSLPEGEYFIKVDNGYAHCENLEKSKKYYNGESTACKIKTKIGEKTIIDYKNGKISEGYISLNIFDIKNIEKNTILKGMLGMQTQLKNLKGFNKIFLSESFSDFSENTNIYFYKQIKTGGNLKTDTIYHYRNVNRIFSDTGNFSQVGTFSAQDSTSENIKIYNLKKGILTPLEIQIANLDKLGKVYNSANARILLNPYYNLPITYTPNNQHYLPDYEKTKQICLINIDKTNSYSNLFDNLPSNYGSGNILENCSLIGDHNRITDIRLQTYIKTENLFNSSAESKSFTHIYIPLSTNGYISDFSSDRREQNYAGEATQSTDNLLSFKQVEGIKISEGDVIVLKPGVVVGAYNYPFTIMVPTDLLPFIKYVKLNNPGEEVKPSKIYTTGVYAKLSSIISFMKDGAISKAIFGDAAKITEAQKYTNFLFDKYDSRPDALKEIEGIVPDRYFHSYYGSAYFTEADANAADSMMSSISTFFLGLVNYILKYRVEILEFLYLIGPFSVFLLLFKGTRKIFTWIIALIVGLLVFPVILLFLVNLINF